MAGSSKTTLRRVLTQSKPAMPCTVPFNRNNKDPTWPVIGPANITPWINFNLDTLNESYGHVLDREIPAEQLAGVPHAEDFFRGVKIAVSKDARRLLAWNDRVLQPTLQIAKQHLGLYIGVHMRYEVASTDRPAAVHVRTDDGHRAQVGHRIMLDEFLMPDLVFGLALPSSKFQSRLLVANPTAAAKELFWPVRQLAKLCNSANTRYGYIVTDQDLVVCCFVKMENATEAGLNVAMMPIPWTRDGEGQLTTDLALWWLCMLAMAAPQHRAVLTEAEVVSISEWETRYVDEERGWVRRHRYSNIELPMDAPPPLISQTPLPGHLLEPEVSFDAAELGSNEDPTFDDIDMSDWDAF